MTHIDDMTGEEMDGTKPENPSRAPLEDHVGEVRPKAETALSERVLDMTTTEKIAFAARLVAPWQMPMLTLMDAYRKEYPPATTPPAVLQAVSVMIPLRAFIALLIAAECVVISAGENQPVEPA